jgi:uncharacterized membrane protein (DUF2068 family)
MWPVTAVRAWIFRVRDLGYGIWVVKVWGKIFALRATL